MSGIIKQFALVALGAALVAPAPARAQLGGLIKKAKSTADQHQNPNARPSDAFGPELTEQTITAVLNGLVAQDNVLGQRDAVAKQRDGILDAQGKTLDAHAADHQAYNQAEEKNNQCLNTVFDRLDKARAAKQAAMGQQVASDPAKLAQIQNTIMAATMQAAKLRAKGDTAGAMRVQLEAAEKAMGITIDPKADTAQAVRECGAPPAKPAWLIQTDAQNARADTLSGQIRALEDRANAAATQASGLPVTQFSQCRERIVNWFRGGRDKNSVQQFSNAELKLFHEHQAQIEKLERVL